MSTPPALTLPDELWLVTLSEHGLEYIDLKHVSRVNKYFHKLEKDPQLDSILFRKAPGSEKFKKGTEVAIHPILKFMEMVMVTPKEALTCFGDDPCNAYDYEAVNEQATSPSSTQVDLDLLAFGAKLTNPQGVTVKAVLQKVGRKWDEEITGYDEDEIISRREGLYDHNGWQGWDQAVVTASGSVKLSTSGYDS